MGPGGTSEQLPTRRWRGARGVPMVEVNPEPTPLSAGCAHVLRGPAAEILPQLIRD